MIGLLPKSLNAANLLTSDINDKDKFFVTGEKTDEGFYRVNNGIDQAISRGEDFLVVKDYCIKGVLFGMDVKRSKYDDFKEEA